MFRRLLPLFLLAAALPARAQLVAYLPLDGNVLDASGHRHTATVVGAVPTAAGFRGGAYVFNGTSDYIEISSLDLNPGVLPQLTMGAWVRPSDISPIRQIISHDNGSYDRSLGLDARGGVNGWSAFAGSGVLGSEAAVTGDWTFVAVAYDQASASATLFVNDRVFTLAGSAALGTGWTYTRIGMNPSYGEYFAGTIDEVFFFSAALTPAQIAVIRTQGVLAIPEPSTWALLGGGALTLLFLQRRRRA
jgi:hypothetical protein